MLTPLQNKFQISKDYICTAEAVPTNDIVGTNSICAICEEHLEFPPKNENDYFSRKQKFVRLRFIGGVYFCALQSAKFFGVEKFLSNEQIIFLG